MNSCIAPPTAPTLGHLQFDEDHRVFLELAVRLQQAPPAAQLPAFDALHHHVQAHFESENALMAPHDFSSKDCHVDEHAAVLDSFRQVRAALLAGNAETGRRFVDQLLAWLPEHADALDRQLTKFLFYRQTGGAAVLMHR